MSKKNAEASLATAASIGQLLRAQFALQNNPQEDKPKTVGFNESENMRLYELYSSRREEYHSTRPSGQRNEEVPMDILAREWAQEITDMGFAERTPAQIKQRIRDMRKFSRKHAHKLGIKTLSGSSSSSTSSNIDSFKFEKYNEYSWAEPKRRSRGPVPDWMSGLAQIMMGEQEKNQEENDNTTEVMEAAFGSKAKRIKVEKQEMEMFGQQKSQEQHQQLPQQLPQIDLQSLLQPREMRELSPESELLVKKLRLADAKLESENLRQQALRLEISYYQRQVQLYDEQLVTASGVLSPATSPADFLNLKLNGLNGSS